MPRFECERCGTTKTRRVLYGYPSAEDFEALEARDDIVIGGCVISEDSPHRVCAVCRWPMEDSWGEAWTAFDGPRHGEFDYFHRPLDQALAEYELSGDMARLALSFDAYAAFGDFDAVAELVRGTEERWNRTGKLPTNLGRLRACLFFAQRASHHNDSPLVHPYTEALVAALRVPTR